MASENQKTYIADLVVLKTKEFKEVKELLQSSGIVSDNAEIVAGAQNVAEITNVLTDLQASKFIDLLIATPEPKRGTSYAESRVNKASEALSDIKESIRGWGFDE